MSTTSVRVDAPWLPAGGPLELAGRGTTFVRHSPAPPGRPTLLLLHGLSVTADANWFPAYPALVERYGIVAIDHRGHGRGIRAERRFRLADCADDAVAALDALGIEQTIAVGYSMGGPIAQLVWHRHRERTHGLVLCATTHRFRGLEPLRDLPTAFAMRARATGAAPSRRGQIDGGLRRWLAHEIARTDRATAMQAGLSLARYDASGWIRTLDVPHAVVITDRDAAIVPPRQQRLAQALPSPTVVHANIDHTGCVTRPAVFVPALLDALDAVAPD